MNKDKEKEFQQDLGTKIRARRENMGYSRYKLAAKLGVSYQQISKYEKGNDRVSLLRLKELAKVLDVPFSYFLEDDKENLDLILNKFTIVTIGKYNKLPRDLQKIVDKIVGLLSTLIPVE